MQPLLSLTTTPNELISKKQIAQIFGNLFDILGVSTELCKRLEARMDENWNPEKGLLGDIFLDLVSLFD